MRGTQSFVYTQSSCWRRPSLTLLEVAWRWAFGIPALALIAWQAEAIVPATPVDTAALEHLSFLDPLAAADALSRAAQAFLPPVLRVAAWLAPVLFAAWVVASSVGRTNVLRRVDPSLHRRVGTLMALQVARALALLVVFASWMLLLHGAAKLSIGGAIAAGREPNLVLCSALAILATLGMFTLWAVAGWAFSVAPLLAMLEDVGAAEGLARSFRIGALRSKLVEINLVMGIVKIALMVVALVLSACPLPFESVATPDFMVRWYAVVTVVYFIASDFFHVVRLVSYLDLWRKLSGAQTGADERS